MLLLSHYFRCRFIFDALFPLCFFRHAAADYAAPVALLCAASAIMPPFISAIFIFSLTQRRRAAAGEQRDADF